MELRKKKSTSIQIPSYLTSHASGSSNENQSSLHYFTNLLGKKSCNSLGTFQDSSLPQKRILTSDIRASIENFYAPNSNIKYKNTNATNFMNKIEQEKTIFKVFRENYYVISEQSNIPLSNLDDFLKAKKILNQTMQMMGTTKHIWKTTDQSTKPISNRVSNPYQGSSNMRYKSNDSNRMVRLLLTHFFF
jgi:hypothetical protein